MNHSDCEAMMIRNSPENTVRRGRRFGSWLAMLTAVMAALAAGTGCQTEPDQFTSPAPAVTNTLQPVIPEPVTAPAATNIDTFTLRESDILKIPFPGSPNLNNVQQIRTDGKIPLPLIGEVQAAGLTPIDLQQKLMDLYAPQLSSKEVTVEVQNSSFPVYVTGSVLRPGKITSDHPMTALEAIMEAGGFD